MLYCLDILIITVCNNKTEAGYAAARARVRTAARLVND